MKKLLLAVAIILAGCSTEPMRTSDAFPVPANRIQNAKLLQPQSGYGYMLIKREMGFNGINCPIYLSADGEPFAEILPGEKIEVYLPPAEHIISARSNVVCGGTFEEVIGFEVGQARAYRVGFGSRNDLLLQPTSF